MIDMKCDLCESKASKRTIYIYITCLVSGIIYSITELSIIGIVTTIFLCVLPFIIDSIQYVYILFGLQFVRVLIPFEIGSAKYGFILLVYLVLIIQTFIEKKKTPIDLLPALLVFFIDVISSAINNALKIGDIINWIGSLIILIYVVNQYYDKLDYDSFLFFFCLAEWTICIVNIISEIKIFGCTLIPGMYGVYTEELGPFAFGKAYASVAGGNGIAFNNVLAIGLCIFHISGKQKHNNAWFYIISIVFFLYTGFLVVARAFYIELVLLIVLFIVSNATNLKKFIVTIIILVLVFSLLYFYFFDLLFPSFERVLVRFESGNDDRKQLLQESLVTITSSVTNIFFGAGTYYPIVYGFTAHNIYFDSFVSLGIVGGSLFWGIIIKTIYKSVIIKYRFLLVNYIPLIMLFTYKYISGSTRDVGFYYYIILCLLFFKSNYIEGKIYE